MLVPGSALALVLAVASPTATVPAGQDPLSGVSIAWSGSPACDGGQALRVHLRRLLAGAAERGVNGTVDVTIIPSRELTAETAETAEVREAGETAAASETAAAGETKAGAKTKAGDDTWTMTLQVSSSAGSWSRRIDGERCGRMIEVAALIAAIHLDPLAVQATLAAVGEPTDARLPMRPHIRPGDPSTGAPGTVDVPAQSRAQGPATPPNPASSTARPSPAGSAPEDLQGSDDRPSATQRAAGQGGSSGSSEARRPSALGSAARAAILGSYGPFPGLSALIVGGVGLTSRGRLLLELAVIHRLRSRHPVEAAPGVELLASLTAARVDACWTPRLGGRRGGIELPLCGGLDLGALRVEAIGLRNAEVDRSLYVAPDLSARLLWRPAQAVGVGLDLGASVALRRRTYGIRELQGPVLETTRAGGHMGLSVEIRLP